MDSNTKKEIADKYIRENLIDYGDLNEKAENQIRDAIFYGLNQGQTLPIDSVTDCPSCKARQKKALIDLMRQDEKDGMYDL